MLTTIIWFWYVVFCIVYLLSKTFEPYYFEGNAYFSGKRIQYLSLELELFYLQFAQLCGQLGTGLYVCLKYGC